MYVCLCVCVRVYGCTCVFTCVDVGEWSGWECKLSVNKISHTSYFSVLYDSQAVSLCVVCSCALCVCVCVCARSKQGKIEAFFI